ncbi:MAG TPA: hypothetical protein VMI15_09940 [Burkholderiales bacterium]|nr:hypothetical protein [Burkholderiales bacterium]
MIPAGEGDGWAAGYAEPYLACVRAAARDPGAFSEFKRDPRYRAILEHVSEEQGGEYLDIVRKESPSLLAKFDQFRQNDLLGGAITCLYPGVGPVSPSTLRYVKVASDLRNLFGARIGGNVAEVGVGYGGQLLIADKVLSFGRYDLFDLPSVLELASRYLGSHALACEYRAVALAEHAGDVDYELAISNYAFSELPARLQLVYIAKVLARSKRGYLTMNSGRPGSAFTDDKLTLEDLARRLPKFDVLAERPLTHPGNYVVVWGA